VKHVVFLALVALLLTTLAPALSQQSPQIEQIEFAERAQILNALTPEHRALLASLVGTLATSVPP
jgi:hypothetical protein